MSVMKSEENMSEKVYNISSRIGKAKAFFKGREGNASKNH